MVILITRCHSTVAGVLDTETWSAKLFSFIHKDCLIKVSTRPGQLEALFSRSNKAAALIQLTGSNWAQYHQRVRGKKGPNHTHDAPTSSSSFLAALSHRPSTPTTTSSEIGEMAAELRYMKSLCFGPPPGKVRRIAPRNVLGCSSQKKFSSSIPKSFHEQFSPNPVHFLGWGLTGFFAANEAGGDPRSGVRHEDKGRLFCDNIVSTIWEHQIVLKTCQEHGCSLVYQG